MIFFIAESFAEAFVFGVICEPVDVHRGIGRRAGGEIVAPDRVSEEAVLIDLRIQPAMSEQIDRGIKAAFEFRHVGQPLQSDIVPDRGDNAFSFAADDHHGDFQRLIRPESQWRLAAECILEPAVTDSGAG